MQPPRLSIDPQQSFPIHQLNAIQQKMAHMNPQWIKGRLDKYHQLDSDQRLNIVRTLPVLLDQLNQDQASHAWKPLIVQIVRDRQDICKCMLQNLPNLLKFLQKRKDFQNSLKIHIIPILITCLNSQYQVKSLAGKCLADVVQKLQAQDRRDFVLRHVIEMAHDDVNSDNRMVAVQLFSSMGSFFGEQLSDQYIGLEMLSLGDDINPKVQLETIKHIPSIAKLVSKNLQLRLLGLFKEKAMDQQNWALRKGCAQIIIEMTEMSSSAEREGPLTVIMLNLLKDSNKWIRSTCYKNLPQFLFLLKGLNIQDKLVAQFCRMPDNEINALGKSNQIVYSCAYSFPAVLSALGKQSWQPDLLNVYNKLLKSPDVKVKVTLASSVHELATILGQNNTQKHLFKVIDKFVKDSNDQVKLGIIQHMSSVMTVLNRNKRQSLIGVFQQFQADKIKWRIRQCICNQIQDLFNVYSLDVMFQYMVPILLKSCSDPVFSVRKRAATIIPHFITKFLSQQNALIQGLLESVKAFGSSPKFTQRQTYDRLTIDYQKTCPSLITNLLAQPIWIRIKNMLINDRDQDVREVMGEEDGKSGKNSSINNNGKNGKNGSKVANSKHENQVVINSNNNPSNSHTIPNILTTPNIDNSSINLLDSIIIPPTITNQPQKPTKTIQTITATTIESVQQTITIKEELVNVQQSTDSKQQKKEDDNCRQVRNKIVNDQQNNNNVVKEPQSQKQSNKPSVQQQPTHQNGSTSNNNKPQQQQFNITQLANQQASNLIDANKNDQEIAIE